MSIGYKSAGVLSAGGAVFCLMSITAEDADIRLTLGFFVIFVVAGGISLLGKYGSQRVKKWIQENF